MSEKKMSHATQQMANQAMYKKTRYHNNNNNNNTLQHQQQHEQQPNQTAHIEHTDAATDCGVSADVSPRDSLNYERRVDAVSCGLVAVNGVKTPPIRSAASRARNEERPSLHIYENVKFDLRRSQQRLLQKFFRHNRAPTEVIYENLCRGCGYGVFEARGQLCNFCACIVNGLKTRVEVVDEPYAHIEIGENIYENVCVQCASVYSTDECETCVRKAANVTPLSDKVTTRIDDKSGALPALEKCAAAPKLGKSKSFNKRDKRSIFYGLIGSLKRSVRSATTPVPQKSLEIVHHVDGFENVFRTQETFDLQRICELKNQQLNSCSDQHIYGRLKGSESVQTLPTQLTQSQSHDPLVSVDNLSVSAGNLLDQHPAVVKLKKVGSGKRPRISRPRLLRSKSQNDTHKIHNSESSVPSCDTTPPPPPKLSLYLADSVCSWLTSLRREVHNYRTRGSSIDDEQLGLCQPKSVPAKQTPISPICGTVAPAIDSLLSNSSNIDKPTTIAEVIRSPLGGLVNCENIDNLPAITNGTSDSSSSDTSVVALFMVEEFKRNLRAKQMQKQADLANTTMSTTDFTTTPATAAAVVAATDNTATTEPRSPRSPRSPVELAQQRVKRQAIYLKMENNNCESINNNANANSNSNSNSAPSSANSKTTRPAQLIDETAVAVAPATGTANATTTSTAATLCANGEPELMTSRQVARQAYTAADKRHGICERNSEFVADILCAFDSFLQRESESSGIADVPNQCQSPAVEKQQTQPATATEALGAGEGANSDNVGVVETVTAHQSHNEAVETITSLIDDDLECKNSHRPPGNPSSDAVEQLQLQPFIVRSPQSAIGQILSVNVLQLIDDLLISCSLNNVVIYYEKPLSSFLRGLYAARRYRSDTGVTLDYLVRKFRKFYAHSQRALGSAKRSSVSSLHSSLVLKGGDDEHRAPISRNVTVDESVNEPRNGSERRVGDVSEFGEAPLRKRNKAKAQIVLKRVSLIEADDVNEFSGGTAVQQVVKESTSSEVVCKKTEHECGGNENIEVMKNQSDEVVLRPKAKDSTLSRNEKVLGKFMESLDDVSAVLALSENNARNSKGEVIKDAIKTVFTGEASSGEAAPELPVRDFTTNLTSTKQSSPPLPTRSESQVKNASAMTAQSNNKNKDRQEQEENEEDIYQPIWQFKTLGEVQERYQTDADYYDVSSLAAITATAAAAKSSRINDSSLPSILISDNVEDHGEWETDDEFMFSTQPLDAVRCEDDDYSLKSSTIRSIGSIGSTVSGVSGSVGSTVSGSTVTGFASSTATIGSTASASLQHPLLRTVGIFYSLLEPKLRAIVYDYDRVHASMYFAKQRAPVESANDSGIGQTTPERSPKPPPRTSSARKSATTTTTELQAAKTAKTATAMPDSVQLWKFMLLDVNYLEDEEDMIVSEQEILRAQQIKEDVDSPPTITTQQNSLQRFKSVSIGNLVDLPNEDDKKSRLERVRNKFSPRYVFKLRSPKSEKKSRGIFRRTETASLYLEDGMKPKYPIFGAPLDQLELNQTTHPHVPRFVVDCVEYIERKDCILQDGLYRASGNKISIDELKQKLCESYIYDPKLLVTDDIHTLTSLLKQFFRELGAPLIPQPTYEHFGQHVHDATGIETLRLAIEQMPEPNRSTLQFLIRHLKNVAACSAENRMPASNLAIVWGPCIFSSNQVEFVDIGRMNTLAKVLIENYERIFGENERLVS